MKTLTVTVLATLLVIAAARPQTFAGFDIWSPFSSWHHNAEQSLEAAQLGVPIAYGKGWPEPPQHAPEADPSEIEGSAEDPTESESPENSKPHDKPEEEGPGGAAPPQKRPPHGRRGHGHHHPHGPPQHGHHHRPGHPGHDHGPHDKPEDRPETTTIEPATETTDQPID